MHPQMLPVPTPLSTTWLVHGDPPATGLVHPCPPPRNFRPGYGQSHLADGKTEGPAMWVAPYRQDPFPNPQ